MSFIPASPQYFYVASVPGQDSFTFLNAPAYTAFTVENVPFLSFRGLQFPQAVATGDVNTGGFPYTGGNLYPSPTVYDGGSLAKLPQLMVLQFKARFLTIRVKVSS